MLDVAKKMLGCRAGAGFRYDDVADELRQQLLLQLGAGAHVYPDNPDSDAGLRASSVNRGGVHAGDYGRNSAQYEKLRVLRPGGVQLQRD